MLTLLTIAWSVVAVAEIALTVADRKTRRGVVGVSCAEANNETCHELE